jgi:hypothetical protein
MKPLRRQFLHLAAAAAALPAVSRLAWAQAYPLGIDVPAALLLRADQVIEKRC